MENIDDKNQTPNPVPEVSPEVPLTPDIETTENTASAAPAAETAADLQSSQPEPEAVSKTDEPPVKLPFKITPLMKILLVLLGILFLLVFIVMILPRKTVVTPTEPTPTPVVLASPSPELKISEFAKLEIFSQFELQMSTVSAHLLETDLKEDKLTFPLLDMEVNFDK